jgi:phosphohistidine swiveling domain-containing protein
VSYVVLPEDAVCRSADAVGGKAASLASLRGAGFNVPDFCVITCAAFETLHDQGPDILRPALEAWLSTQPPGTGFAVRSSARGEDSAENSFAGLYATVLDVRGTDAVIEAVQRCWESYGGEEARSYRASRAAAAGAMGVVVQRLVPAQWSGVAFGANPVNGALSEIVINASAGLGEALVAGEINPEQIVVSAKDAAMISRRQSADQAPLPQQILEAVWRAVLKANQHYRFPQDIEWAAVDGQLYVLQSRPITTLSDVFYSRYLEPWANDARASPDDPARVWTRAYADEIWAPPVSPLFYNIHNLTPSFVSYWNWHGDPGPLPPDVFKYHKASAYLDVRVLQRQYDYHPAFSRIAGIVNFFPSHMHAAIRTGRWLWRGRLRRTIRFECQQRRLRSLAHNHRTLAALWPGFIEQSNAWFELNLDAMSLEEIAAHRAELNKVVGVVSPACGFAVAYHAHDLTFVLTGLLDRWFGDGDRWYAQVTSGLDGSVTVAESQALWELAQLLRQAGERTMQAASAGDFDSFAIEAAPSAPGRRFLDAFETFWFEHRHRGASYKDLVHPRWGDDKAQLLSLVVALTANDTRSPREQNLAMAEVRRRAQAELLDRCTGLRRWRRPLLRWLFRYNEIYMSERDNHRYYFDRVWHQLRRIYCSHGRRLCRAGILEVFDDVFFLGAAEVDQALRGELDASEMRARVKVRRRVWNETLRSQPPKFIAGYAVFADSLPRSGERSWSGIGASPGVVTGRARIVYDVRELPALQRGEILVTRQTDPAWSTVFPHIAGLVLETGGVLAHGASLCREFNLPCVTALERATSLIRDGDMVTVDGARGAVWVAQSDTSRQDAALAETVT